MAHRLLAHALVAAVVQAPDPLHAEAVVALPAAQVAAAQITEPSGKAHAVPLIPSHCPLQAPVPPQAVRVGRVAPLTGVHFPVEPASLQDSHCPSHLPLQHTPSVQYPDAHMAPEEQLVPLACASRQAPVVSQYEPVPQELAVQLLAHLALPSAAHLPSEHRLDIEALQAPTLLQTAAVATSPFTQVAAVQTTVLSGNVQVLPLVPSH